MKRKSEVGKWSLIPVESYAHLVKDVCAGCGNHIKPDITRYEQRGNFCSACETKINFEVRNGRKLTEEQLDQAFRGNI